MAKNIVILGAGFGGLRTARILAKKLQGTPYKIILIDKNSYHTYTPALYEIATAYRGGKFRSTEEVKEFEANLIDAASFPVREVIDDSCIDFIQEEIIGIDASTNTLTTSSGDLIKYRYCVVALGSSGSHTDVEGAQECCGTLNNINDALEIRRAIESLIRNNFSKNKDIQIITVGAGFTGFELTTEMAKYIRHLAKAAYDFDINKVHIKLIEAKDNILPEASPAMRRIAIRRLKKLGIEIVTGKKIITVEPHQITLEGGEKILSDFVLWGGGVKGNNLLGKIKGAHLHRSGRLETDTHLRAKGVNNIFVVGDSSYFYDEKRSAALPATAWAAEHQAETAAENVYRALQERPLLHLTPKYPGFVVAAGGKYAIAKVYGFVVAGFLAWILKRAIDLKYILSLYSFRKALRIWIKGVRLFSKND
ncbi:MAG: FAD-dependent oxidoreductase [Candidatus Spechtbacterales bacterium]